MQSSATPNDSSKNLSPIQKKVLLEFVEKHSDLKTGRFSSTFTKVDARRLWESLTLSLNAMEGAEKNWKQWRKSYQDWKTRAKSVLAKRKSSMGQTGGGPPTQVQLDADDEALLQTIDPIMIDGIDGTEESETAFDFPAINDVANDTWVTINKNNEEMRQNPMTGFEDIISSVPLIEHEDNNKTDSKIDDSQPGEIKLTTKPGKITNRSNSSKRLDQAIIQTDDMISIMKAHTLNKKRYYDEKLEIMRGINTLKERQTTALEAIATALRRR